MGWEYILGMDGPPSLNIVAWSGLGLTRQRTYGVCALWEWPPRGSPSINYESVLRPHKRRILVLLEQTEISDETMESFSEV